MKRPSTPIRFPPFAYVSKKVHSIAVPPSALVGRAHVGLAGPLWVEPLWVPCAPCGPTPYTPPNPWALGQRLGPELGFGNGLQAMGPRPELRTLALGPRCRRQTRPHPLPRDIRMDLLHFEV